MISAIIGLVRAGGILANLNGLLLAATVGTAAFVGYTYWQRSIGASNATKVIVKEIEKEAEKAATDAQKDHAAAAKPGAFDRLRNDPRTCPNCVKGSDGKPVPKLAPSNDRTK